MTIFYFSGNFATVMKNLFAFLVLISHMNFTMFIPQVDEVDGFDAAGQQVDDINSLYEYVDEVVLGHKDTTPEDEDDDSGAYYHIQKVDNYYCNRMVNVVKRAAFFANNKKNFPVLKQEKLPSVFFEIQCPPPEA